MRVVLFGLALTLVMGCGKNEKPAASNTKATNPVPTKTKVSTRAKIWEFKTGGDVWSSPAIGSDGTVYIGSWDNKLYAINGKTGVKLWEF